MSLKYHANSKFILSFNESDLQFIQMRLNAILEITEVFNQGRRKV